MAKERKKMGKLPPLPTPTRKEASGWIKQQHSINVSRYDLQSPQNKGDVFRQHGLQAPGRYTRASAAMRRGTPEGAGAYGTPERAKAVRQWQSERPGGGSPSGASHQQWVAWGTRNPNRASNASRAMGQFRREDNM